MEYVHKQTINFRDDRTPLQRRVSIGYEGDNLVERLEFVLPELVGGQVAKLMITGADAIALNRVDDGRYAADLTREMIGPDGRRDAYVRIDGVSGQIWQSAPLRIVTGKLPDVEEEIEKVYPTAVGQMLTAMAEHTGEMQQQEERVERAAQRAEEAAERAETGGGSGGPGEDGGYYQPSVTDGVLTWTPSKADMPGVPASDVRGPAGQDGQPGKDGKTAYQYAQDGGYEGAEAEFAEKMAQELPEAYTLPVATADRLGGVKIGDGLDVNEDGRVSATGATKIQTITDAVVSIEMQNNTEYHCENPITDLTIRGFVDGNLYGLVFTAGDGITVTVPEALLWAVAEPIFTIGSTYWICVVPFMDKYLAAWTEVAV